MSWTAVGGTEAFVQPRYSIAVPQLYVELCIVCILGVMDPEWWYDTGDWCNVGGEKHRPEDGTLRNAKLARDSRRPIAPRHERIGFDPPNMSSTRVVPNRWCRRCVEGDRVVCLCRWCRMRQVGKSSSTIIDRVCRQRRCTRRSAFEEWLSPSKIRVYRLTEICWNSGNFRREGRFSTETVFQALLK